MLSFQLSAHLKWIIKSFSCKFSNYYNNILKRISCVLIREDHLTEIMALVTKSALLIRGVAAKMGVCT